MTRRRSRFAWRGALLAIVAWLTVGCATTTTTTESTNGSERPLAACTASSDCETGEYCRFALGACGGTGSCESKPRICTKEFDPVCGCDQNIYSNACGAASEGLSLLSRGRCGTGG